MHIGATSEERDNDVRVAVPRRREQRADVSRRRVAVQSPHLVRVDAACEEMLDNGCVPRRRRVAERRKRPVRRRRAAREERRDDVRVSVACRPAQRRRRGRRIRSLRNPFGVCARGEKDGHDVGVPLARGGADCCERGDTFALVERLSRNGVDGGDARS